MIYFSISRFSYDVSDVAVFLKISARFKMFFKFIHVLRWFPTENECNSIENPFLSSLWSPAGVCDPPRVTVVPRGCLWPPRGCLWSPAGVCGPPRVSVVPRGCLWSPAGVCGCFSTIWNIFYIITSSPRKSVIHRKFALSGLWSPAGVWRPSQVFVVVFNTILNIFTWLH